jgi:hypothetical protein
VDTWVKSGRLPSPLEEKRILSASTKPGGIGRLNESPLHAALRQWVAEPGDRFEVVVDGFVVDIVRDGQLIEVQTGNFSAARDKLRSLATRYHLRLVYPVAAEKWIVKPSADGQGRPTRRKSPRRGRVDDLFVQLVSFPELMREPLFSLEVLLIQEEEERRYDGRRGWRRRGWVTGERRLLQVLEQHRFESAADLAALLPADLPGRFGSADLAVALGRPRWLAQKMIYCLRQMGALAITGKEGRALQYARAEEP